MAITGYLKIDDIPGESKSDTSMDDSFDFAIDPVEQKIALLLPAVQSAREASRSGDRAGEQDLGFTAGADPDNSPKISLNFAEIEWSPDEPVADTPAGDADLFDLG